MKYIKISVLLAIIYAFYGIINPVIAQENCVVEATQTVENNPDCKYTNYVANYDFYDSCYQKYLIRKKDWETRCFRYWDEKNKAKQPTPNPVINPSPIIIYVAPSPIPSPKKIIYSSPVSSPSLLPTISPAASASGIVLSASDKNLPDTKQTTGLRGLIKAFLNFLASLF